MNEIMIFICGIVFGKLGIELLECIVGFLAIILQNFQNDQALRASKINKKIQEMEMESQIYDEPNRIGFQIPDEECEDDIYYKKG